MGQPEPRKKSKAEIVLSLLMKGREIEFPDYGKVSVHEGRLVMHLTSYSPRHPEGVEKLLDITDSVTFGGFMHMANSLSETEIFILVSEQVLTEIHQEKADARRHAHRSGPN